MDAEILRRARDGDEAALGALCAHCHPMLCRFFAGLLRSRQDAEDLAQETLLCMLKALPSYRALPGSRFESWLFRIGYSRFIDLKRRRDMGPWPEGFDPTDGAPTPEQHAMLLEDQTAVRRALALLDEESRAMVLMRYELDMRHKDIAKALGTHAARVKWRVDDARKKLKRSLTEEGSTWTD